MKNRLSRYRRQVPKKWRESKPLRAAVGAVTLVLPIVVVASSAANAGVNLTVNPGAEQMGPGNFPLCWGKYGSGKNTYSIGVTNRAHSGGKAIQVSISKQTSGQRSALILQNQSCAPYVTQGHQYNLGLWYMSNTPDAVISLYRHDVKAGRWQYWMDLKNLPVSGRYTYASVRTPQIPANTDQISWGVTVYGKGTVITDDYSTADATVAASPAACSAGAACTRGVWQVMPFSGQVRAMHAVMMYNGKVLLVAGSGNDTADFAAGTFRTVVYDPVKGTITQVPTPADFFCSGHIQLADGKVLVLGGNKAYPTAANKLNYEGLNTSYIFNPVTDRYVKENNLNGGHWYPSATELGNGNIISFGGLAADGSGSVTMEYFKYSGKGSTAGQWLSLAQTNQDYTGWGLYPDMILMQNGELFYSGSHVFGNNETPFGTTGTKRGQGGAGIIGNIGNATNPNAAHFSFQTVTGLQDTPGGPPGTDMTDQSMAILLPPAQSQKVMLMGGGNILYTKPATRLTDLIDLNSANPHYTPGPLLPRGKLMNARGKLTGQLEPAADGKMYVSMVILPNSQVLETGGGLLDRQAPYVSEASMYNPATNRFTSMAADPVPRGYHSTALLLPDGRVMTYGNNPGDGTFNEQIAIYSPPYLFRGPRPQITSVAYPGSWHYGKSYTIKTNQKIVSAELIRPASVTHQSDPNQRYVALPISGTGNTASLNVTSNPNLAPPGWYMLFVNNANGVPSVAKWINLS